MRRVVVPAVLQISLVVDRLKLFSQEALAWPLNLVILLSSLVFSCGFPLASSYLFSRFLHPPDIALDPLNAALGVGNKVRVAHDTMFIPLADAGLAACAELGHLGVLRRLRGFNTLHARQQGGQGCAQRRFGDRRVGDRGQGRRRGRVRRRRRQNDLLQCVGREQRVGRGGLRGRGARRVEEVRVCLV